MISLQRMSITEKLWHGVMNFIKRYSSEHEVVLDLACGTGSLSEALARLDYDVVGVDLSDQMLESHG